jgi:hypothetical protein
VASVSDRALTPELALAYLGELSTDIHAAALLDGDGRLAAHSGVDAEDSEKLRELVKDLFDQAAQAAPGDPPDQFEVALPEGSVFAIREHGYTAAVVAGRYALSSLMFYDLRMVLADLAGETP